MEAAISKNTLHACPFHNKTFSSRWLRAPSTTSQLLIPPRLTGGFLSPSAAHRRVHVAPYRFHLHVGPALPDWPDSLPPSIPPRGLPSLPPQFVSPTPLALLPPRAREEGKGGEEAGGGRAAWTRGPGRLQRPAALGCRSPCGSSSPEGSPGESPRPLSRRSSASRSCSRCVAHTILARPPGNKFPFKNV